MKQRETWEIAADDVISVLLHKADAWIAAALEHRLAAQHMPTARHKAALQAIYSLRRDGEPVEDTTIMDRANGTLDSKWIAERTVAYDEFLQEAFEANIKIVRKYGLNQGVQNLLDIAKSQIAGGKDRTETISNLVRVLTNLEHDSSIKDETADRHGATFEAMMNSEPSPGLMTGIRWLDTVMGGFQAGHNVWIAAPYKSRKSTIMLNAALGACLSGGSVAIMSREMPRKRVAAQSVAMLATAYLKANGLIGRAGRDGKPLDDISAQSLQTAGKSYQQWDGTKSAAVTIGIRWYNQMLNRQWRVYDATPEGGSLSDGASLERMILRDKAMYGGQVYFVDYLQLFRNGGTLYEDTAQLAQNLQHLAMREQITIVVLAQQNESKINSSDGYSPGVKGGGDPAAAADYLIESRYNLTEDWNPEDLQMTMKLSRHGSGGAGVKHIERINPASGLMLDSSWINVLMKKENAA